MKDRTPLILAIISKSDGSLECVNILLSAGADVSICNAEGNSAYQLAVNCGRANNPAWEEVLTILEKPTLAQEGQEDKRVLRP
ncbi:ankyrin repeat domain-containing protein [Candidatus Comchoanobacter bicostacola]|uniref:Ankyrin repeat domain-containing protein n=1 Tax=Candidatus Comchoanobacter bicostacola TaxID=2919598 RepID=A0ABY5DMH4_9GAMM|nr:ankyrin repeat domain-containing protein [Candidatus Comchoanobacter bicostacola]UTC24739.1 ankyrin repeat domain-containing protein [Candidatus Comchoanobacter bicostacola]